MFPKGNVQCYCLVSSFWVIKCHNLVTTNELCNNNLESIMAHWLMISGILFMALYHIQAEKHQYKYSDSNVHVRSNGEEEDSVNRYNIRTTNNDLRDKNARKSRQIVEEGLLGKSIAARRQIQYVE